MQSGSASIPRRCHSFFYHKEQKKRLYKRM